MIYLPVNIKLILAISGSTGVRIWVIDPPTRVKGKKKCGVHKVCSKKCCFESPPRPKPGSAIDPNTFFSVHSFTPPACTGNKFVMKKDKSPSDNICTYVPTLDNQEKSLSVNLLQSMLNPYESI